MLNAGGKVYPTEKLPSSSEDFIKTTRCCEDIMYMYRFETAPHKKVIIHQVTTMLATSKKSYFQVITSC